MSARPLAVDLLLKYVIIIKDISVRLRYERMKGRLKNNEL